LPRFSPPSWSGAGVGAYLYFSKDAATTSTTAAPPAAANLPEDIEEITVFDYPPGQEHLMAEAYAESPPVGGPHDATWADCDGAVYDQQVRSENAVHSLEHGAVWITYDVDAVVAEEISVLAAYVRNQPYMLMSPYDGLSSPISVQSWNHQLFVDSVDDPRISSFIQLLRQNPDEYPEVGATCSQPAFLADPVLEGEQSQLPGDARTRVLDRALPRSTGNPATAARGATVS